MRFVRHIAMCFAFFTSSIANAAIVSYSFSGYVSSIYLIDIYDVLDIAYRVEESDYAGPSVRKAQRVNGYFEYDTVEPIGYEADGSTPGHFFSGGASMSLRFEDGGPAYTSDRDSKNSSRSVEHYIPNSDVFQIGTVGADRIHFGTANVVFESGLIGGGIPTQLDISNSFGRFMYTYARNNGDGTLMVVMGSVDTLRDAPNFAAIPEPSSLTLFVVGVLGFGAINLRSRTRRAG